MIQNWIIGPILIFGLVGACIARPQLSDMGMVINTAINNIHQKYEPVCVDKYVIMPNHIHMILILQGDNQRAIDNGYTTNNGRPMAAPTVSNVIN